MDYIKATAILLIIVVALLSVIFQIMHVVDIIANITDIWIWIAAALIGVGFNLITRKRTQQPKTETTPKISLTKEIPEFYSSRKELPTLEDFLGSARDEIDLMGFSLWDIVIQNRATIVDLLKQGKHIRFILLNPTSDHVKRFEEAIVDANLKDQIEHSLEQLRVLKNGLSDVERGRLDIRTHDLLPFHTIIAVDEKSDSGMLQVESYVYGTDSRSWPSLRISRKNQPQLFEKYWKSYEYVHEHSRDIDATTKEIERSKEEEGPQLGQAKIELLQVLHLFLEHWETHKRLIESKKLRPPQNGEIKFFADQIKSAVTKVRALNFDRIKVILPLIEPVSNDMAKLGMDVFEQFPGFVIPRFTYGEGNTIEDFVSRGDMIYKELERDVPIVREILK